jgi:DNA-binding Xre family transcriptional regulator
MTTQIITSPSGERLVVLPEAEYRALIAAREDAADLASAHEIVDRLNAGATEVVPVAMVDRMLAGENPIRVWREHRGMRAKALAAAAGISATYLSEIETGKRDGTISTMKRIAEALGVTVDDLI